MPVSYTNLDKKKGAEKSKLSLSIHRKNVDLLINDNTHNLSVTQQNYGNRKQLSENNNQLTESKIEEKSDDKLGSSDLVLTFYKENKPVKRTRNGTYSKTLNAAKKLKSIDNKIQESIPIRNFSREPFDNFNLKLSSAAMLNGHHQSDVGPYGGTLGNNSTQRQQKTPIATLSNLGNTCFLNSVLYTLRFAPRFLHNLHHLVADLAAVDQKLGTVRLKSSSLGRSAAGLAASGTRSWSSKDLLSLGQPDLMPTKSKIQIATERLHETYSSLRAAESRCLVNNSLETTPEPYAADPFLTALRDVNSTFEGNRQQDAHELLVCVLDSIRETCRALRHRAARLQHQENNESVNALNQQPSIENDNASNLICSKSSLGNLRKSWKKRKEAKASKSDSPTKDRARSTPSILEEDGGEGTPEAEPRARPGWDFIAEDFEGTTVLRTTCLECEMVTERKQAMCDICIPVAEEADTMADDTDEPFLAACVTSECLRDQNKYWCERCLRYNEARRSVAYETLPRILVLQLKRFSGGMEKITRHAPTPRVLACFCECCAQKPANARPHRYTLWAVIVHLGQSLSGGHYVAYTRAHTEPGRRCEREERAMAGDRAPERPGFMRSLFTRGKGGGAGCGARDCCAMRPPALDDDGWLMCDDELVKQVSKDDFDDLLSPEPKVRSPATPYLLFYVKSDTVPV